MKKSITLAGGSGFWTPNCTIIENPAFSIASLFKNGEQGFYYDPDDMNTMFQDMAGKVAVTAVGQPVGLILDKSKGLAFGGVIQAVNVSGWIEADSIKEVLATTATGRTTEWIDVKADSWYYIDSAIQNRFRVQFKDASGVISYYPMSTDTTVGKYIKTASTTTKLRVYYVTGIETGDFSIALKQLLGNPAFQATSASRPLLKATPQRIEFDLVDDSLSTKLATQLTNCTLIRAVPNVGTTILLNQTISADFVDKINHCGLIVINRALTSSETAGITKLFNKASGVL